jgi:hypothetical protein
MSAVPSAIASAIANIQQTDKVTPRAKPDPPKKGTEIRREAVDRLELVDAAEAVDAVKGLASNEKEDAREDHQEHDGPQKSKAKQRPRLDVEG